MSALLTGQRLAFAYDDRQVLRDVSIELSAGEVVALVGPNGAGKSTLLHLLVGILAPTAGEVRAGGRLLNGLSRREIARHIAFVPQETRTDFAFTVRELVMMGRTPHLGRFEPERASDLEAVTRALEVTGTRDFEARPVSELSGGERQRVHIARAIAQSTDVLLLDEPTSSLDVAHQLEIMNLVRGLVRNGKGAIVALHDLSLAARYADRVVVLADGHVAASGTPATTLTEEALRRHFGIHSRVRRDTLDTGEDVLVIVPIAPAR